MLWVLSFSLAQHINATLNFLVQVKWLAAAHACSIYSCPLIYRSAKHSRKGSGVHLGDFLLWVNSTRSSLEATRGCGSLGQKLLPCTTLWILSVTPSPVLSICLTVSVSSYCFSNLPPPSSPSWSSLKAYLHWDEG